MTRFGSVVQEKAIMISGYLVQELREVAVKRENSLGLGSNNEGNKGTSRLVC